MGKQQDLARAMDYTILAIREVLMEYYKGSCVESIASNTNILVASNQRPARYNYQRQREEVINPKLLAIGGNPIASLSQSPNVLTLHDNINRSPEFRKLRTEILRFMAEYLRSVKVEDNTSYRGSRDDKELILRNLPSTHTPATRTFLFNADTITEIGIEWPEATTQQICNDPDCDCG